MSFVVKVISSLDEISKDALSEVREVLKHEWLGEALLCSPSLCRLTLQSLSLFFITISENSICSLSWSRSLKGIFWSVYLWNQSAYLNPLLKDQTIYIYIYHFFILTSYLIPVFRKCGVPVVSPWSLSLTSSLTLTLTPPHHHTQTHSTVSPSLSSTDLSRIFHFLSVESKQLQYYWIFTDGILKLKHFAGEIWQRLTMRF